MTSREQLIHVFAEFGNRYPEWRFGQMVSNVAGWLEVDDWTQAGDEWLLQTAKEHLQRRFELADEELARSQPNAPLRKEILQYLTDLGKEYQGLGFSNLLSLVAGWPGENIYDIEDWKLATLVKQHWEQRGKDEIVICLGGGGDSDDDEAEA